MSSTLTVERRLWKMARDAARKSFDEYCRNPCQRLHLYYSCAVPNGKWGQLEVSANRVQSMNLAHPLPIPISLTEQQMKAWIYDKLRGLPICGA